MSGIIEKNLEKFSQEHDDPKKILSEVLTYLAFSTTFHYSVVSSNLNANSLMSFVAASGADLGSVSAALNSARIVKNNIEQKWRDSKGEERVHPIEEVAEVEMASVALEPRLSPDSDRRDDQENQNAFPGNVFPTPKGRVANSPRDPNERGGIK